MNSISVVILTKNEEENIIDCLDSVSFCDEIIVIDDNSSDKTSDLVKNYKHNNLRLVTQTLDNDFARQRNFALNLVKNGWILFIDADERIPKKLQEEIRKVVISRNIQGYYIKRQDVLWDKILKYGEAGDMKLLRLGRVGSGRWQGKVHEVWNVNGEIKSLENFIKHYPHKNIKSFLEKINNYSTIRANELYDKGVRTNSIFIILYPKAKFFLNFVFKKGYKDGIAGFIHAILMSFHSFLVRGKLWMLWKKKSI